MPDERNDILNSEYRKWVQENGVSSIYPPDFPAAYKDAAINAMDENGKRMCLELLEYMAENEYKCFWMEDDDGEPYCFFSKGSGHPNITKEQLFENFL